MTVADAITSLQRLVWETCGPEPVGEDYHEECREIRAALKRVEAEIARLQLERDAYKEECADWERGADEELARAWKERAEAAESEIARLERDRDEWAERLTYVRQKREAAEAEVARLERERTKHIPDECAAQYRRVMHERDEARAEAARLRDGLRACGEHLEHCCRTDIGWREQTRSHDAATKALHAAEDGAG